MKKAKLQEADLENERDVVIDWLEIYLRDPSLNTLLTPPNEYVIRKSKLEEVLFDYLSDVAPTLLEEVRTNGFLKYAILTKAFEEKICKQLEYFICGDVIQEGINGLSIYSKPQKFCGKVFNVGDLTYTCKSCAHDPTCVFCHFCFHQSVHKDHKYKLHASNGSGGYCDCGDEEAWTSEPSCDYHKGGLQNDESWDPFAALPGDVQCRATFVFIFILHYCIDLLVTQEVTEEDEALLPTPLKIKTNDVTNSHIVMLYNDESHSYEEVINTLIEAIKCDRQQAFHFAAIVDKEGRSSIYNGEQKECEKIVADCKKLTSKNGKSPLKCKSMHRDFVAHQLIALDLMNWLNSVVNVSDGLRRLLCLLSTKVVSGVKRDWSMSFLELLIREDTSLWKVARARSHQLFMNAVLMDTFGRKEFAVKFAECYKVMIHDFMKDDHEHSISVAALSVQVFTVPSLANMLMVKCNILKLCLETFLWKVRGAVGKAGYLDFQDNPNLVNMHRANFILHDVQYLLRHKADWSPELLNNFLESFDVFVTILKIMHGMDGVTRKTLNHVAYEPNWETAFTLQLGMIQVIGSMLTWCCSNLEILKACSHRCIFTIRSLHTLKYSTADKFTVINHDVTTKMVSIHYALSRFLAGLVTGASKYSLNIRDFFQMEDNEDEATMRLQLQLLEYPLRALVLSAQINAQMWKRNGYAILHQSFCYHNVRFVTEMYDRDILMLQALVCVMNNDHFITAVINKFNLVKWASECGTEEKGEALERENMLAKDFLLLIIHILSERYVIGVGNVTNLQILEREIIHRLSLGPVSRSSLVKYLPNKDPDEDDESSFEFMVDDILKEVAVYKEPSVSGKGTFELKPEVFTRCNQYFMHFTRAEQFKMVEEKKRINKKLSNKQAHYISPLPEFHSNFKNVIQLLCCKELLHILEIVISRALKGYKSSEEHIEEVLMIIAIGILEEKRCRNDSTAEDFEFIKHLRKEEENAKSFIDLIDELAADDSRVCSPIVRWVKQLLQEEMDNGSYMEVDAKKKDDAVTLVKEDEKAEKTRLLNERKKKMMKQMNDMQKAFMKKNKSLFESCEQSEEPMEDDSMIVCEDSLHPVAIGGQHSNVDNTSTSVLCILCQEEQTIDGDNFFIVAAFVHKSKLLKMCGKKRQEELTPELNNDNAVNISSCGHIVHMQCWEKYYKSVKDREGLPFFQRHQRSCIDIAETEYLCPLCNSLCNTVLPLLPRVPVTECLESEDISLSEFLTYLERFSAEMLYCPKKDVAQAQAQARSSSNSNLASFFTLISNFVGSDIAKSSSENFMELFARKLLKVFCKDEPKKASSYSVPYSWMACSYTLQAYECSTRTNKTNVFSSFSERQDMFWHALIQYLASNCMIGIYEPIQDFGDILFQFFCNVECDNGLSILDADILGVMISLRFFVASIQNIYQEEEPRLMNTPLCLINDVVFKICLIAYLVKLYLTAPVYLDELSETDNVADCVIVESWRCIQKMAHGKDSFHVINASNLKEYVLASIIPFMRCAALFFHYLTGVKLPTNLTMDPVVDELLTLQKYLNLPEDINEILSVNFLIGDPLVKQMVERWCKHEEVTASASAISSVACYREARKLITLPKEYSSLINMASGFRCPTLGDASRNPALCLLCGTILCSQCHCCGHKIDTAEKYGPCSNHSMDCSAGIGIFLRIRESEIVLMYNRSKGSLMPSPYLDEYGETDRGFRRGNPLYLNEKRYESVEQLWLRQKIPETIAQAMESNRNLNSQDWASF